VTAADGHGTRPQYDYDAARGDHQHRGLRTGSAADDHLRAGRPARRSQHAGTAKGPCWPVDVRVNERPTRLTSSPHGPATPTTGQLGRAPAAHGAVEPFWPPRHQHIVRLRLRRQRDPVTDGAGTRLVTSYNAGACRSPRSSSDHGLPADGRRTIRGCYDDGGKPDHEQSGWRHGVEHTTSWAADRRERQRAAEATTAERTFGYDLSGQDRVRNRRRWKNTLPMTIAVLLLTTAAQSAPPLQATAPTAR